MKWCPCGDRKARYIMRQYGLTNQKFTRKDFKGNEKNAEFDKPPKEFNV